MHVREIHTLMEGKRRMLQGYETRDIKKGPWKVEEDEVLMNHVKKYGARDWSSIRSKGLLRRTGKSCRLRWVNKLRPDLKTGVKFSTEEERTVIDLQAQFGNKWAKIATYLPGRTDNDVKNFWSSRQKRLARILHTPSPSSTKSHNPTKQIQNPPTLHPIPSPKELSPPQLCSSIETAPFGEVVYPNDHCLACMPPEHIVFPHFPIPQPDYPMLMESQGFNFMDDEFEHSMLGTAQIPILPSPPNTAEIEDIGCSLVDDFPPIDLFDRIDQLPSPSHWSSPT